MAKKDESCGNLVTNQTFQWTDETEAAFLSSFIAEKAVFRPVGIFKHFCILIAFDRFIKSLPKSSTVHKNMDIELMWNKLESLYDLDALEQSSASSTPFPNEQREFKLPDGWITKKKTKSFSSSDDADSATDSSSTTSSSNPVPMKKQKTEEPPSKIKLRSRRT